MQWLKQEGCPWPGDAVHEAARFGHIEILEWLGSEGDVLDEWACAGAIQGGQLETLKWLRSLDPPCPWNKSDCKHLAETSGHAHILRWMESN